MKTQKPLRDLIPEIITHVATQAGRLHHNAQLLAAWEGRILPLVEESMQKELSPSAFARARQRIAPINLILKVVEKLSKVYSGEPSRTSEDQSLVDWYVEILALNQQLSLCQKMFNLHKYTALEPYVADGKPALRIIPASRFTVYSDSQERNTEPSVFIKFVGDCLGVEAYDSNGALLPRQQVALYYLYSDDEFLAVDSEGAVRQEFMGESDGTNPYGQIPFVYVSASDFELIPTADTDMLPMAVGIIKLLTDLNYATGFMSHSVIYIIDAEASGLSANPDSVWMIKSSEGEGKTPSIGTIEPKVQVEATLKLIESQASMWLESRGIKSGSLGKATAGSSSSGVAKMLDEGDATDIKREQMVVFRGVEKRLWNLIAAMHGVWTSQSLIDTEVPGVFSKKPHVTVSYEDPTANKTDKERLAEIKDACALGIMSVRQAARTYYPSMTEDQLDELLLEIAKEKAAKTPPALQSEFKPPFPPEVADDAGQ